MSECLSTICSRKATHRGMCGKHYRRWRNGKNINCLSWHEKSNAERFWDKVKKTGSNDCWEWIGCINSTGYGSFRLDGKNIPAHRAAWILENGPILSSDIFVCHHCDNPTCVNSRHMFLGTLQDNVADMYRKGRGRSKASRSSNVLGEKNPQSVLREGDVVLFRQLVSMGSTQTDLCSFFGIHKSTMHNVIRGHSWRHV